MQPHQYEALLDECRDLFRDQLIDAVRRTFDGMNEALTDLANKAADRDAQRRYLDARDMALRHRDVIEAQFRRRLVSEFQSRVDKSRAAAARLQSFALEELRLVGDDDLNETLSFNDMAAKMRRHCDEEMSALDQRAAVLLGRPSVAAEDNPFGAKVVADAFKQACQQVDCPLDVRLVFMRSFERLALEGIRASCRQVNDLLVANAVLPKIRYGISRQEDKARAADKPASRAANEESAAEKQDMFSMLSRLVGGSGGFGHGTAPAPGVGVGGAPLADRAQLLGSLTNLQRGELAALGEAASELGPILAQAGNLKNVLHQLKSTSVAAGMSRMDAVTLDIVSMLFDALFEDPKIPAAVKGLIGRLQLPMLKVAIADKDFFSSREHPARRLLDTLGQVGLRLPADFGSANPLFPRLEGLVEVLVHGFQDKMDIFDEVRLQLETLLGEEDSRVAARMHDDRRRLDQAEGLAVAKVEAEAALAERIAAHAEVPPPIVEFLVRDWIKYLVVTLARDGRESAAWREAIETTERLLWSVERKPSPQDRQALMSTLPALLRALKAGLSRGGIGETAASAFFSRLMACHTEAMRPLHVSAVRKGAPLPPLSAASPEAPLAGEPASAFGKPVVIANPFGEGDIEVSENDLDFTTAAVKPLRPTEKVRLPTVMVIGAWVSVEDGERTQFARLHYVSPLKSHFLFAGRQGEKVYECSRSMLAERLRRGEIVLLDGEPDASLFDRVMEGIFGKLGNPFPKAA